MAQKTIGHYTKPTPLLNGSKVLFSHHYFPSPQNKSSSSLLHRKQNSIFFSNTHSLTQPSLVLKKMVKAQMTTYEEVRKQRIEENRKRMEEFNITKLALDVRKESMKPSPMKRVKPRSCLKELVVMEARRSSRIASLPAPVYKDMDPIGVIERPRTASRHFNKQRRDLSNRVYASYEARHDTTDRAEELESILENPCFVKPMTQSHVTGGFWLGLPKGFCAKNLPRRDDTITLVDEEGVEYPTVYLADRNGLSGGWRGFAIAHDLVDGDALVFELIKPRELKVHIVKVSGD